MRRHVRLLLTLTMVLGAHLTVVWFLASSSRLSAKTKSGSLQFVWITPPAVSKTAPERTMTQNAGNIAPRRRAERAPPPITPTEEDNAIHPAPDWAEELKLAAKNAVANQLAQKRHELDFAHAYPLTPRKPPQFAWDYAATHRVEAIPGGGILINLSDDCVLILFPLPFFGCRIGKPHSNGDLFEHRHDQ
jgi:hypothetical protein